MSTGKDWIDILNRIGEGDIEIDVVVKIFLLVLLGCLILCYILDITQCLIVGVVFFILLFLAALVGILK